MYLKIYKNKDLSLKGLYFRPRFIFSQQEILIVFLAWHFVIIK